MAPQPDQDLYQQITSFYAHQMQLMDNGAVDEWVRTFTVDAEIANNANPAPANGRETILRVARRLAADVVDRGVVHRHWTNMLATETAGGGRVRARSYALVVETPIGGASEIWRSTVCQDELVLGDDGWQVRRRRVTHDDI